MREYIESNLAPSPLRTRLRNALRNEDILELPVWYFLAMPVVERFMKIGGIGEGCRRILDEALARSGGLEESLGSMTALWQFAETIGIEFRHDRGFGHVMLAVIAGSMCRYSHFGSDTELVAVLQRHGLRPGMPLEELFVYVPAVTEPTEPKKLTVAEELLAFLGAKVSVLHSGPLPEVTKTLITEETTVGECAMIVLLATMQSSQHTSGLNACTRVLNALAHRCLGSAARERLGITNG